MARSSSSRLLLLLVVALAALAATARVVDGATANAPAPSADCTDALLSLSGCLTFVQEGSTEATPSPDCCSGLKDVVRKEVACLCQVFQSGRDFGISLNMTKALQLPADCKVKTPPVSKCHVSSLPGVPSASPVPAPSAGAPSFGPSPSPSTPSGSPAEVGSPAEAATGSGSSAPAPAPAPARSGAASLSAPSQTFFAAATAAATLLVYRVL